MPSGAEINDLIIEALAPVDPAVTFEPVDLEIGDYAIHFVDGRLYLAISNSLLIIDYNNDPKIIDLITFDDANSIVDLEIDAANLALHILTDDNYFHAISLVNTAELAPLSDTVNDGGALEVVQFDQFIVASDGTPYALSSDRVAVFDGLDWNNAFFKSQDGKGLDITEVNGVLYFSSEGDGIERWDMASGSRLSKWTTANNLHSDSVTSFYTSGNQILMSSEDAGLARYDWNTGFWLSTWTVNNWLTSNDVSDVVVSNNVMAILNGNSLQTYNTQNGVFLQTYDLQDFGLVGEGEKLVVWPNIGVRSPTDELIMISDGGGDLAIFDTLAASPYVGNMLLASGPTSGDMDDAVELNGILYVAADGIMNRFDTQQSRWLTPKLIGDEVNQLVTDGTYIYIAGDTTGAHKMTDNGTILQTWDTADGLASNSVQRIAVNNNDLVTITPIPLFQLLIPQQLQFQFMTLQIN